MAENRKNIGEIINLNAADKKNAVSPRSVNEFFEELAPGAAEAWPFDFSSEGYSVSYQKASFYSRQAGMEHWLRLSLDVFRGEEEAYFIKADILMDCDKLKIRVENLYRIKGALSSNFGNTFIKKMKNFIEAQDKARGKNFDASEIVFEAASRNDRTRQADCGGYVWANQGLDFANEEELRNTREHFASYAGRNGVKIDKNDLKYFTKPCHFAAFNCGISIKDKFGKGTYLGKAFLLLHSWEGRLAASPYNDEKPEEQRYAEAYNNKEFSIPCRKRMAQEVLSSSYRSMLKKYRRRYSEVKEKSKTEQYMETAKAKLAKMLERF